METLEVLAAAVCRYWQDHERGQGTATGGEQTTRSPAFESAVPYARFVELAGLHTSMDRDGFFFWPPNLVCFVEDLEHMPPGPLKSCVVFADYLVECWHYGIWVQGPNVGQVIPLWGTDNWEMTKPLGSLSDFFNCT